MINITVFTKDHQFFYTYSEVAESIKLDDQKLAAQIWENIDFFNFKNIGKPSKSIQIFIG